MTAKFGRILAGILAAVQVAGLGMTGVGAEDAAEEAAASTEEVPAAEDVTAAPPEARMEDVFLPPDTEPLIAEKVDFIDSAEPVAEAAEPLSGDPNEAVASGKCGDNLTWTLYGDGLLSIGGTGPMWSYSSNFNYTFKKYVTTAPWGNYSDSLTELCIEEGVTRIGEYAFHNCSGFTGELVIPDSVAEIGNSAFSDCSGFTGSLTIPDGVKTIERGCFSNCSGFTGSLTIPDSVILIGYAAFSGCNFTGNLTIPNQVITIESYAFSGCENFTGSLLIPDSVTDIGYAAFSGCDFTDNLVIGNNVITIGNSAFFNCGDFSGDLTIGDSVTNIGDDAFMGCSFAGGLVIGCSVTTIGSNSFSGCGFNGNLKVPDSVSQIKDAAFSDCIHLNSVIFCGNAPKLGIHVFTGCADAFTVYCYKKYSTSFITYGGKWNGYPLVVLEDVISLKGGEISLCAGVTYQIEYTDPAVSGWVSTNPSVATVSNTGLITAHKAGTTVVRALDAGYNTIGGIYNVTVVGETVTDEYTLTAVTTALRKKSYNVGDTFDPNGLVVQVRNKADVLVTVLTGLTGTNALILDVPYVFTSSDISPTTGTTKTSTIILTIWYNNKPYQVPVSGLTVTVALKTLTINTSRDLIVEMKNKSYPVGTTIDLSDIYRIGYFDTNNREAFISYPETMEYGNLSLEVLTVNSKGATTTKTSNKNRVDSADVFTDKYDEKLVTLRLSVGDYRYDFEVSSGDRAVAVYRNNAYSSTYLLGTFDDLAEALEKVNDVRYQWGSSSSSVYSDSYSLYLRLSEDAELHSRDFVIPERNFEIDLNGHKLTMYSDSIRFQNSSNKFTASLTNLASGTAKVTYTDLSVDDLLIDKSEKITFKYQEASDTSIPGVYTLTVASGIGGTVTAKPAVSLKNTVTIAHGNDVTFTITPEKNYEIDTVKVKSGNYAEQIISVSTNSSYSVNKTTGVATYTMKDVKANATLTAVFRKTIKPGDLDGDDNPATPRDAMVLARYIAGWDGYADKINLDAADLDGDGIPATPRDAMVLARHIAGWTGYEIIPLGSQQTWYNPYTDVRVNAAYYEAVRYVTENDIMYGITPNTFGPDLIMTRAQFVTILGRMFLGSLGIPNLETPSQKYEAMLGTYGIVSRFTDVSNDDPSLKNWAVPYIIWAEREGLVLDFGDGKFRPNDAITHQEMYAFMYMYAVKIAHKTPVVNNVALRATDADKIGEGWSEENRDTAITAVKYAQQQNYLVSSVVIDPAGNALRYEIAILLMQFAKNVLGWE